MEFYTHQAALNAIEGICDDQDKTVHGPFDLGAPKAAEAVLEFSGSPALDALKKLAGISVNEMLDAINMGNLEKDVLNKKEKNDVTTSDDKETWTLNSHGQVIAKKGSQIGGDPDHPEIYLDLFDNDSEIPNSSIPGKLPNP
jgi:hypothetical protein